MDDGVHWLDITRGPAIEVLNRNFNSYIDADIVAGQRIIYELRFFPRGMGEDSLETDAQYAEGRFEALDAPNLPARYAPAFELRRPLSRDGQRLALAGGAHRPLRLVIARGDYKGCHWRVSWLAPGPYEEITAFDLAVRLANAARTLAARDARPRPNPWPRFEGGGL